jgi:hypothetical protein
MKNVVLGKDEIGSNWIAIGEELNADGTVKNGIKLLYADENYTDNEISLLEKQMRPKYI